MVFFAESIISKELVGLVIGTVLGGLITTFYFRKKEAQIDDKIKAERKTKKYSKTLWVNFKELRSRLTSVRSKLQTDNYKELEPLNCYPIVDNKIDWYTKEGYYISSTAYLFSIVSSWISVYRNDVIFLDFGKKGLTKDFVNKIESLKNSITNTDNGSIMWHYYRAIGEKLIKESTNQPISFAEFVELLSLDENFRLFFGQTFHFISTLIRKDSLNLLNQIIADLDECIGFIEYELGISE